MRVHFVPAPVGCVLAGAHRRGEVRVHFVSVPGGGDGGDGGDGNDGGDDGGGDGGDGSDGSGGGGGGGVVRQRIAMSDKV